jgi:Protein of unknown function (DUF3106)
LTLPTAPHRAKGRRRILAVGLACVLVGLSWVSVAAAQIPSPIKPTAKVAAEQIPRWTDLKPAQQTALKPLEKEWAGLDGRSKQKWIELSTRFPKLTPAEQSRVQERMSAWIKMTPLERGEARANFQEAKQVPAQDRQERWKAYQALSPEERERFATRATPTDASRKASASPGRVEKSSRDAVMPQPKSNIVPNPALTAAPKAVAPTVVQARPGASTTLITRRPTPPGHQQTGLPKIAATPDFVDKATLLPQRGPQGAAARAAPVPAPESAPQQ